MNYPKLSFVTLMIAGFIPTSASEPRNFQLLTSLERVPEGLSASEWSSIRSIFSAEDVAKAATTPKQTYLKASNTEADDQFGYSVAVSGDTVVVGAYREDSRAVGVNANSAQANNDASLSGAAYVFARSGKTWKQQAYLKASNSGSIDQFGVSVAVSGNTIVIGANGEDSNATGVNAPTGQANNSGGASGAAYVFTRSGETWSQQAYLKASNTGQFDDFGSSVAISGDTIVVGAVSEDSSAAGVSDTAGQAKNDSKDSGAAYVFTRSGNVWSQQAYLKSSNPGEFDLFGSSVAVSKNRIVVGAYGEDSNAIGVNDPNGQANNSAANSGAAYVFVRVGSTWSQQAYLKASNTEARDGFGASVAISDDTVVVGAPDEASKAVGVNDPSGQADNSALGSGAAYIFAHNNMKWSQEAYLKSDTTGGPQEFGISVATSGDQVVVGSPSAYFVDGSGTAFVFVRSNGNWSIQANLRAKSGGMDDRFGRSVAISGGTIISGAQFESGSSRGINSIFSNTGTTDASGAAYIFAPPTLQFLVKVKVNNNKFGKVTGTGSFTEGSPVTLKAKAKEGRIFLGWYDGKLISKKKVLIINNLNKNRVIVAKFK